MSLSIANKVLLGFGLVIALTVALGVYVITQFADVRRTNAIVGDQSLEFVDHLRFLRRGQDAGRLCFERVLSRQLLRENGMKVTDTQEAIAAWEHARRETESLLEKLSAATAATSASVDGYTASERKSILSRITRTVAEMESTFGSIVDEARAVFPLIAAKQWADVQSRIDSLDRFRERFDASVEGTRDMITELVDLGKREIAASYEDAKRSILIALGIILVIGITASIVIQRSVARPLARFVALANRVGDGDLGHRAEGFGRDEFGRLGESFNQMIEGLRRVASKTMGATADLSSASNQILAATQQQTASTSEQASAVQETTSTMQEISASGSQIAERARHVAGAAESASEKSQAGLAAVRDMNQEMDSIQRQAEAVAQNIVVLSEKTHTVGEIIRTVNDIAEQSNLLALNAGIEAAAAGEHGRSFAVVASEMKTLADQAKEATVQVQSILGDIQRGINTSVMLTEEAVKRVARGRDRSDLADNTIRAMADSIRESITTFQQIVAATNQQQIGLEQVTQALKNITGATTDTASGTRQLEASAKSLHDLAISLQRAVESYRL